MSAHTQRRLLRAALIVTAPFLLITFLWCIIVFNFVNPMQLAFVTDFEIENRTPQPVWVTPIGTFRSGGKSVLPQFSRPFPAIPVWRSRDLRIDPGERRRIYYDWDDINFSDIAIRDSVGVVRNLVIDTTPTANAYHPNEAGLYAIQNLNTLPTAAPVIVATLAPKPRRFIFWTLAMSGLVAPFLFVWLWRKLRTFAPAPVTAAIVSQPSVPADSLRNRR